MRCAHFSCTTTCANEVCKGIVHAWLTSRTQIGDMTGLRLDAAALKVLAHPLRSRLLSALRVDGPATATDLAARLVDQLRRDVLPPAQARVGGSGLGQRRGRGQAPALAGGHRLPHLGGQRLRRRRGLRDGAQLAGPRLRPPLRREVRAVARRAGDLARRVARRRRHERQLRRRHPRAGRAAQGRARRAPPEVPPRRAGQPARRAGWPSTTRVYPLDLDGTPTGKEPGHDHASHGVVTARAARGSCSS